MQVGPVLRSEVAAAYLPEPEAPTLQHCCHGHREERDRLRQILPTEFVEGAFSLPSERAYTKPNTLVLATCREWSRPQAMRACDYGWASSPQIVQQSSVFWSAQRVWAEPHQTSKCSNCRKSTCHAKEQIVQAVPISNDRSTREAGVSGRRPGEQAWQLRCTLDEDDDHPETETSQCGTLENCKWPVCWPEDRARSPPHRLQRKKYRTKPKVKMGWKEGDQRFTSSSAQGCKR